MTLGVNADGAFGLARDANLGSVRVNLRWRQIHPAPGTWDFSTADQIVGGAEARGLEVLGILSTAPEWAGGGPHGTVPPADTGLWREFVGRVAERYAGRIAAYEIWNEPNLEDAGLGVGWDRPVATEPTYAEYLEIAAGEIRSRAPGTLVVAPGTSSEPDERTVKLFRQLQEAGGERFIDILSFHANGKDQGVGTVRRRIQRHLALIAEHHPDGAGKPIWITEMGWRSAGVGEEGQRRRTIGVLDLLAGGGPPADRLYCPGWDGREDFTRVFLFLLQDLADESAGLYRQDGTPKAVVTDYLRPKAFPAVHRPPASASGGGGDN